jgi:hypothetical protein
MRITETAVLIALTNAFENKKLDMKTAVKFTVDVYKLAIEINKQQKLNMSDSDTIQTVVYFIKEIAKGEDGLMGTRDDLIDANTLDGIVKMLEADFLEDMLWVFKDSLKLKMSWYKTSFCFFKYCFLR